MMCKCIATLYLHHNGLSGIQPCRYGPWITSPSSNSPPVFGGAYCEEFLNEFFTYSFTVILPTMLYIFDKHHAPLPPPPKSSIHFSFDYTTPQTMSRPLRTWMEPGPQPNKRKPHLPLMDLQHSPKLSIKLSAPVKHETHQGHG